jgi:hypothetical protein
MLPIATKLSSISTISKMKGFRVLHLSGADMQERESEQIMTLLQLEAAV